MDRNGKDHGHIFTTSGYECGNVTCALFSSAGQALFYTSCLCTHGNIFSLLLGTFVSCGDIKQWLLLPH
jgi:hypothetical protein